jgi:hypothetical protein
MLPVVSGWVGEVDCCGTPSKPNKPLFAVGKPAPQLTVPTNHCCGQARANAEHGTALNKNQQPKPHLSLRYLHITGATAQGTAKKLADDIWV